MVITCIAGLADFNRRSRETITRTQLCNHDSYYYFYIIDEWCKKNTKVSSFAAVDMEKLKKYNFPISPIKRQKQIVSVLDKFEKLTIDISIGLPAEIEARRKQYEYYRNKLLTFL